MCEVVCLWSLGFLVVVFLRTYLVVNVFLSREKIIFVLFYVKGLGKVC